MIRKNQDDLEGGALGKLSEEEHLHPPAISANMPSGLFAEEESSAAVINLGPSSNPTPTASNVLPKIGQVSNTKDVFMV